MFNTKEITLHKTFFSLVFSNQIHLVRFLTPNLKSYFCCMITALEVIDKINCAATKGEPFLFEIDCG